MKIIRIMRERERESEPLFSIISRAANATTRDCYRVPRDPCIVVSTLFKKSTDETGRDLFFFLPFSPQGRGYSRIMTHGGPLVRLELPALEVINFKIPDSMMHYSVVLLSRRVKLTFQFRV